MGGRRRALCSPSAMKTRARTDSCEGGLLRRRRGSKAVGLEDVREVGGMGVMQRMLWRRGLIVKLWA